MNSEVITYTRNKALVQCDIKGVIIFSSAGCLNIFGIVPEKGINLTSLIPGAIEKIMTRLASLQAQDCVVEMDEFHIWATKLGNDELLLDIIDASILKRLESSNLELQKNVVNLQEKASLGTMVAQLCHEMNTPLGVSTTGVTFLQDRCEREQL